MSRRARRHGVRSTLLISRREILRAFRRYEASLTKVVKVLDNGEVVLLFEVPGREDLSLMALLLGRAYSFALGHSGSPALTPEELQDLPDFEKDKLKKILDRYRHPSERLIVRTSRGYSVNLELSKLQESLEHLLNEVSEWIRD